MTEQFAYTECVRQVATPSALFDVLLETYSKRNNGTPDALNLIFHNSHVSCRSFGIDCGPDCERCNNDFRYECVLARYLDGELVNVLVMPSVPMTYGIHDVLVDHDVHFALLPYLPDAITPDLLRRVARGPSYSVDAYQEAVRSLNMYKDTARALAPHRQDWGYWDDIMYVAPLLALGLTGEAGEVANKVKKIVRNSNAGGSFPAIESVVDELGDVLWYTVALLDILEYDVGEAMLLNVAKLESRKLLNQIATENRGEVELSE